MKDLIRLILDYLITMLVIIIIIIYSQFVYSVGGQISQDLLNHFTNSESTLLIILSMIAGIIFGVSKSLGSLDTLNIECIFKMGTSLWRISLLLILIFPIAEFILRLTPYGQILRGEFEEFLGNIIFLATFLSPIIVIILLSRKMM
jgi:hypothetical protein